MLVLIVGESGSGWIMNRLKDGSKFYFNTNTKEYKWSRPDGVVKDHGQLNKEEIQVRYTGVCDEIAYRVVSCCVIRQVKTQVSYTGKSVFK